jgi:hypothetical protein
VVNRPVNLNDPDGHKACTPTSDNGCDDTDEKIIKLIDDIEKVLKKDHEEANNALDTSNTVHPGTSLGCQKSTYTECFYSRELLEINGSLRIDKKQFAILQLAVFYDIKNRTRTPRDRLIYDTPFWDAYGKAPGKACYSGSCYGRNEVNYFAQGMWSAANNQSMETGEFIVSEYKKLFYSHPPSAGTLYWFKAGYVAYQFLDESDSK